MKQKKTTILYKLPAQGKVKLTIVFGDKQKGNSALQNFNKKYVVGDVTDVVLGSVNEIKGKSLFISSMVTDVNPSTDWTSITYSINDEDVKTYEEETDSPNDSIVYATTIKFV
ncbi:MAG TPA: hypothetical protein PKD91_06480 [Bacteroidia bacterium]|nr:hypothetical protein [Bacteroidia bacterium]